MLFYAYRAIPFVIGILIKAENHHNKVLAVESSLKKYLLLYTWAVFLFPTIGTAIWLAIWEEGNIKDSISETVSLMGEFFLYYVTANAFVSNGYLILNGDVLLYRRAKYADSYTERDKMLVWATRPWATDWYLASFISVFMISFAYVAIAPLVCVAGALWANVRYFTDKYNLLCLFYVDHESRGQTPKTAVRYLMISISIF